MLEVSCSVGHAGMLWHGDCMLWHGRVKSLAKPARKLNAGQGTDLPGLGEKPTTQ
jgi:hypothetical protein